MANSHIPINSAGASGDTNMQTYLNTIGSTDVEAQAVVMVNSTGAPITTQPVSGPLTNAELRGTAVPVSGTVAAAQSGDFVVKSSNASNFLASVTGTVTAISANASNFLSTVSGTVGITANSTVDVQKILGTTVDVNSGTKSAGTQRVVIATDQPALTNKLLVTPDSNIAVDLARIQGQASVASVTGVLDVMPRKRTVSTGLAPTYVAGKINTSTTTQIVQSTVYLSALHVTCSAAGTTWALNVTDRQTGSAGPLPLIPNFVVTAAVGSNNPISLTFDEPIICTSGINVITIGGTPGNVAYFATYWS